MDHFRVKVLQKTVSYHVQDVTKLEDKVMKLENKLQSHEERLKKLEASVISQLENLILQEPNKLLIN